MPIGRQESVPWVNSRALVSFFGTASVRSTSGSRHNKFTTLEPNIRTVSWSFTLNVLVRPLTSPMPMAQRNTFAFRQGPTCWREHRHRYRDQHGGSSRRRAPRQAHRMLGRRNLSLFNHVHDSPRLPHGRSRTLVDGEVPNQIVVPKDVQAGSLLALNRMLAILK